MPRSRRPYWADHLPRRPIQPAIRRSAAAFLAASALAGATAFAVSPLPESLGLVAAECDQPKAMRQLAAARQTRTDTRALLADLRLQGRTDPRARALASQIGDLGFTPAQHTGWRQKAIDVSDQLNGTTDPKLRAVALTLARNGYGATPADLIDQPPPPPGGDVGQALGQGASTALGGAINGAAQAADGLARKPAPDTHGTANKTPKDPQIRTRTAQPPLPQTCGGTGSQPAEADQAPTAARPSATATASPRPSVDPPGSAAGQPAAAAEPTAAVDPPDDPPEQPGSSTSPASTSSAPSPSAPSPSASTPSTSSRPGAGTPDPTDSATGDSPNQGDVARAREAIQLLGELMQALGAGGDHESSVLQDRLQQAMDSGVPRLQPVNTAPSSSGSDPAPTDQSTDSTHSGDSTQSSNSSQSGSGGQSGAGSGGAWEPAADKLAQQVSEAAGSDPLAEQLAEKLRGAGIQVPERTGGGTGSGSGGDQVDSSTNDAGLGGSGSGSGASSGGSGSGNGSGSGSGQSESQQGTGSGGSSSGGSGSGSAGSGQAEPENADGSSGSSSGGGTGDQNTSDHQQGDRSGGSGGSTSDGQSDQDQSDQSDQDQSDQDQSDQDQEQKDGPDSGEGEGGTGGEGGAGQQAASQGGGDLKPVEGERGAGPQDGTWDKLADCESSGDWSADTGNGYSGGLQFDPNTWAAFGGEGDPSAASREQQIAVAEKVKAEQGWNAWPSCSKKLGLS